MVLEALANVEGTPREIVTLNAGAALYAADVAASIGDGIERAREAIASGAARRKLDAVRRGHAEARAARRERASSRPRQAAGAASVVRTRRLERAAHPRRAATTTRCQPPRLSPAGMRDSLADDYRACVFEADGAAVGYALFRELPDCTHLRHFFVARRIAGTASAGARSTQLRRDVLPARQARARRGAGVATTPALAFWTATRLRRSATSACKFVPAHTDVHREDWPWQAATSSRRSSRPRRRR